MLSISSINNSHETIEKEINRNSIVIYIHNRVGRLFFAVVIFGEKFHFSFLKKSEGKLVKLN